jgi:imidazolonepropionase-like amidohydrolase
MNRKVALTNVRVFDGWGLLEPATVVIDGDRIGVDSSGAEALDCGGGVLLPGLIDAHVHLQGVVSLEQLSSFGVTTALDMSNWPPALVDSLRGHTGLTDIRSAGISATSPGSGHSRMPGRPQDSLVPDPSAATQFVASRIAEGSDYIKIVADVPGPDQPTLNALVAAAHARGMLTVAHASKLAATQMAIEAGVDIVTHAPLDTALDADTVKRMLTRVRACAPTLAMMEGIAQHAAAGLDPTAGRRAGGADYGAARASVTAMYQAGVPILAGTDANGIPFVPYSPPFGESLHHELELLVDAGLPTVDALRAATASPAHYFGLTDRGAIAPGLRADLVLVDGDPIGNISTTRRILRVWCAGLERQPHE